MILPPLVFPECFNGRVLFNETDPSFFFKYEKTCPESIKFVTEDYFYLNFTITTIYSLYRQTQFRMRLRM
jgi:hypothetical protein